MSDSPFQDDKDDKPSPFTSPSPFTAPSPFASASPFASLSPFTETKPSPFAQPTPSPFKDEDSQLDISGLGTVRVTRPEGATDDFEVASTTDWVRVHHYRIEKQTLRIITLERRRDSDDHWADWTTTDTAVYIPGQWRTVNVDAVQLSISISCRS